MLETLIRDMLLVDAAVLASHSEEQLQSLMDCSSQACQDFGLTISLKRTNLMGKEVEQPPVITVSNYELGVVHQFIYLDSTITDNLSCD